MDKPTKQTIKRLTCKTCKGFGDKYDSQKGIMVKCPDCKPKQPNIELLIVKTIQGLTTCINDNLDKLCVLGSDTDKRKALLKQAIEETDLFEKTTLYELQKAFE